MVPEKHFASYKTIKSTDVLGNTAELKKSLKMPKRGQSAYQMAPSLLVHSSGWPVQSNEDLMDHIWLRAEERGNLSGALHPEYRRGVNKVSDGQNRQNGQSVEERGS